MRRISIHQDNVGRALRAELRRLAKIPAPSHRHPVGIVICGGGDYFPSAYVCIRMLRRHGCALPIELWLIDGDEYNPRMTVALEGLGVRLRQASRHVRRRERLTGWQLKPFAILHSAFRNVIALDADNVPLRNPEFLLESEQFRETGAIFWPDFGHLQPDNPIWKVCDLPYRDEPEFESGQIVVDRVRCWRELNLAMWFNWHKDFFYQMLLGDKDTFHIAFRKLNTGYSMPATPVKALERTMCQHDFAGERLFQHRNMAKWTMDQENRSIFDFRLEPECKEFISDLRRHWRDCDSRGRAYDLPPATERSQAAAAVLTSNIHLYRRVGFDERRMAFSQQGFIDVGAGQMERRWQMGERAGKLELRIFSDDSLTCVLRWHRDGVWRGRWDHCERMPVELTRADAHRPDPSPAAVPAPRAKDARFVMRAPFNSYTGYGLHSCEVAQALLRNHADVRFRATSLNETFSPIPQAVRKLISARELSTEWELLLHPPGAEPAGDRKTVFFTMWESSRLHESFVRNLNRAVHVIVPSAWNASCFSASGVDVPISVVPLGIDTGIFRHREMAMDGPCVFGTAARLESGGARKGLDRVVELFKKAFPREADVRLWVKAFPDCPIHEAGDGRVTLTKEFFSAPQLAEWFAGITCFVSAAKGEGWGLMQHQALATGRPLISARFGGITEFFGEGMGYPVGYRLGPGTGLYKDCGIWAEPDDDEIIGAMRSVYHDRTEARERGRFAARHVGRWSWDRSHQCLLKLLRELGVLPDISADRYCPRPRDGMVFPDPEAAVP